MLAALSVVSAADMVYIVYMANEYRVYMALEYRVYMALECIHI